MWDFLYERSLGCIGVLKDWLMRALILASRNLNLALNLAILEKTALSGGQCEKMLSEAREGETRLAENNDSRVRLRHLLNLPDEVPVTRSERAAPASKVGRRTPGLRRPQWD